MVNGRALAVHGRAGHACPVCGTTVAEVVLPLVLPVLSDLSDGRQETGRPAHEPAAEVGGSHGRDRASRVGDREVGRGVAR